jgi:PAS domain S-box-containing protein
MHGSSLHRQWVVPTRTIVAWNWLRATIKAWIGHDQGFDLQRLAIAHGAFWQRLPTRFRASTAILACLLVACCLFTVSSVLAAETRNVLVLYSNNRVLPANIEVDRGLREAMSNSADQDVVLFSEFLDRPTFTGPGYEKTVATYLREKYSTLAPEVIVVAGQGALEFLMRHRAELFPSIPVVHVAVDRSFLQSLPPMPSDVIGIPVDYDFAGTIEQALRWHPDTRRLVIVTGSSALDRQWESKLRADLSALKLPQTVEFLTGLSSDAIAKRLRELGDGDVVFTPGYFADGSGRVLAPRESAVLMAAASNAPVYGPFSTFIGTGIVGGRMPTYIEMGRQGAKTVSSLLGGVSPAMIRLPADLPAEVQIDWRQARRWGISADDIPDDVIVHFRTPSIWEEHRKTVINVAVVFLLQAALIAMLLVERRLRRRTALALEESEERMNLAADAARLSMWIWDIPQDKIWTTTKLLQRAGLSKKSAIGFDRVLETVHPADRDGFERAVRKAVVTGEELDVEYRMLRPDGEVRWVAARGRADGHSGERLIGVAMDITARKSAELQADEANRSLTLASRLAVVGELTAMVAHEINQPLGAILSNADAAEILLDSKDPPLDEIREIISHIRRSDVRASEAVLRIRGLLRKREIRLQPIDLNAAIEDVLRLTAADLTRWQIPVRNDLAASLPPVFGDWVHLQQVLLNLIMNAMDAMKETPVARRLLMIGTRFDGKDTVEVVVADRGPGIDPGKLAGIFDSFVTTKSDGMGLGLSIARTIVTTHRGRIWAENQAEGGAVFHFTVKVA